MANQNAFFMGRWRNIRYSKGKEYLIVDGKKHWLRSPKVIMEIKGLSDEKLKDLIRRKKTNRYWNEIKKDWDWEL